MPGGRDSEREREREGWKREMPGGRDSERENSELRTQNFITQGLRF